jgi:hypothetical protein
MLFLFNGPCTLTLYGNMLCCSNVFNQVEENSIEIWKYQMYFLVMEFQVKSRLAPPLSMIEQIIFLIKYCVRHTCRKKEKGQYPLQK